MKLKIKSSDLKKIEAHAREAYPYECVGLLVGTSAKGVFDVREVVKAKNTLDSPVAFEADPQFVYEVYRGAEKRGLQLIGVYHSHPNLHAYVSARDAAFMKFWGHLVWVIIGMSKDAISEIKAFTMQEGKVCDVELEVIETGPS
ncbi:MAG: Mov34/MPN/PAD-1 family protein [Candidatus Hadarchaeum sp.]|uniref:Mov34/MPN/PAD-1 family protein n=1 Tax=Candidatus Hadarchaeum sp. TaxID=2883567 RepID=UPI003D0F902E